MRVSGYSTKDLGAVVGLFLTAGCLKNAQQCLDEMQRRLTVMKELMQVTVEEKTRALTEANLLLGMSELSKEPNKLLEELEFEPAEEPTLKYRPMIGESLVDEAKRRNVPVEIVAAERIDVVAEPEPKTIIINNTAEGLDEIEAAAVAEQIATEPEGLVRDENGKVTHVSTQPGKRGYDPDIHANTELKILCNGMHIEQAIAADTVGGTVWYYKKNERGRIKTLSMQGRVEIKGLD